MATQPIRVLLVDDSPIALTILQRLLQATPDIEVVGAVRNGEEALQAIPLTNPQVICTDLHMPKMDGLRLTEEVMARFPRPILVISASVQEEDSHNVFRLLQAGAVDVFPKPAAGLPTEYEKAKAALVNRIKVLAGVTVFTRRRSPLTSPASAPPASSPKPQPVPQSPPTSLAGSQLDMRAPRILAVGASTGGPQALQTILQPLPATFPVPVLCVQHISEGFLQGLVDWLNKECAIAVTVAQSGTLPQPGTVYFPPDGRHLELDPQGRLLVSNQPAVAGYRPSVTLLFQAVAQYYRRAAVGVLLTGMGRDGADGLQAIAQAGGLTIAQDEATSVVFGMPKAAIAIGAAQNVLPLDAIAPRLIHLFRAAT